MKINLIKNPFPHIIIDDTYSEEELALIWHEMKFLKPKLSPPEEVGASYEKKQITHNLELKKYRKKANGIFLNDIYTQYNISDILRISTKLFNADIMRVCETDLILSQICYTNFDSTLLNYYDDGEYYLPHRDEAVISMITVFHKTPKEYKGGELNFPEYEFKLNLDNNQTLIFPSVVLHEVMEIKSKTTGPYNGRFSITKFTTFK